MASNQRFDFVISGAGLVGCLVASQLSSLGLKCCLIEKNKIKDIPPFNDYSPLSYLPSPDLDPFEVLEKKQMGVAQHQGLTKALSDLDERSRTIIQSRWLKEENQATLHQLAEKYGVSAERIRQIEVQAMKKMKAAITQ